MTWKAETFMSQFTCGGEGHQHLGAVGENSLEDAGEGVQQGGGFTGEMP